MAKGSVLVTGAAGFIGSEVCLRLLERGEQVIGLDNLSSYYDVSLKEARLSRLVSPQFTFEKIDLADLPALRRVCASYRPDRIVHLAAQAGVRYSLTHPQAYLDSNIHGFLNLLECSREFVPEHLVFASSSSVYGANRMLPYSEEHPTDHPLSFYAASKKANELMAHAYSHLHQIPMTGLRFFTVYGPWGRPDMALFLFTKKILEGAPIDVFHGGQHLRDFTYISDTVEGVLRVLDRPPASDSGWNPTAPQPYSSSAPYRLYNLGNSSPVLLDRVIACLEDSLGHKAVRRELPIQAGDVLETFADVSSFESDFGFRPQTSIESGIERFVHWYREFYRTAIRAA